MQNPNWEKVYCIDSNVILEDAQGLLKISENSKNLLVFPETVIDEIDIKKSGFDEVNFQAREFGRLLSEAEIKETIKTDEAVLIYMLAQGMDVVIASLNEYNTNNAERSIRNDRKIIECSKYISDYYNIETCLLTNDIMCRTRAISMGMNSKGLMRNEEILENEFIKEIGVHSGIYQNIESCRIEDIDKDHKIENYCYHFKGHDGNEKLAYSVNSDITLLDDKLYRYDTVKPLNRGQKFLMAGMLDPRINICIADARAGSGKTLLAITAGIKLIKKREYDRIIYIRNSVESVDKAEEVGFLPGLEEKFAIYNYPLYDTLNFIAQRMLGKKIQNQDTIDAKVQELVDKYKIETMWPGALRGRTISNAFVVIDEIQNIAKSSLQTILTRLDKDCKVVCIGSNNQIDHKFINKYNNGLSVLLKAAKEENPEVQIFGTELDKVVRGKITEFAERIFSN